MKNPCQIEPKKPLRNILKPCAAFFAGALLAVCAAQAAEAPVESAGFEKTFGSFSACDAGFFKTLHDNAKAWDDIAPLGTRADISWIEVGNRRDESGQRIAFRQPPLIAGLKFLSYFDEISEMGTLGAYYFWGFIVEGDADEVAKKIKPLLQDSDRFRKDGTVFARTEVWGPDSRWLPRRVSSGSAPGTSKVERAFVVEPEGKGKSLTRISCTLQGGVTRAILEQDRPDIDPKDYPAQLSATFFDDTKIPDAVIESLDAARAGNPLWAPKFKKLSYTLKVHPSSSKMKDFEETVEIEAQSDGLLRVREVYGDSFEVQRLMLVGLVNLKARMSKLSDGRVFVANKLKLDLPAELKPGAVLNAKIEGEYRPHNLGDTATKPVAWKCEVKERLDASTIFSSLTGKADRMDCPDGNHDTVKIYLEDLGLVIGLETQSSDGLFSSAITRMDIER